MAEGPYTVGIAGLAIAHGDAGWRLYSVTHHGGGIGSYAVTGADQPIRFLAGRPHGPQAGYLDTPKIEVLEIGGQQIVMETGLRPGVSQGAMLHPDGSLGAGFTFQNGGLPGDVIEIGQFSTVGGSFVYTARDGVAEYDIWSVTPDRGLAHVTDFHIPLGGLPPGSEIDAMMVVPVGPAQFMVSVSALANAVIVQRINPDGSLGIARTISSDLGVGLNAPTMVTAVTVAGVTYLVVASGESSSLTTMRLAQNGSIVPLDHVIDERTTRFAGATAMDSVMVDGRAFVFVGGSDDGISVFTVMPGGVLLHLATLADRDGWSLADVGAIRAELIGGKIALFVTSKTEPGITQFSLDPGTIGRTATVGAGHVSGTNGNDMLKAGKGTLAIHGGAGDDILIAGNESVALVGGAGADTFVLSAVSGRIAIRDYEHGVDRLDFTNLGMIRSTAQLVMRPQDYGIKIFYGNTVVDIFSHDGRPLSASQLTDALFPHAHYPASFQDNAIYGTQRADTLLGSEDLRLIFGMGGDDVIFGSALGDILHGGYGHDTLHGGRGDDLLRGEAGSDLLFGGEGDDRLQGGAGHDTLHGGPGDDGLVGGAGNDLLFGGTGDDRLVGGKGDDTLYGEDGNDWLNGNGGNDVLHGGDGDDTLIALVGHNELWGGRGNDSLQGGRGRDTMDGGQGNDTILGEGGDDLIWGRAGNDLIDGGEGNDTIDGGQGHDTILGGAGDDSIFGARHDDMIRAGPGNDHAHGGPGNDTVHGEAGDDTLLGGLGDDHLFGGADHDLLMGGLGHDMLDGGAGNDTLIGGPGADTLTGGAGADVFDFRGRGDYDGSTDVITDFTRGVDRIDMRGFDLAFIGTDGFSAAGQVRYELAGNDAILHVDMDGDGLADLSVRLVGLGQVSGADLWL